MKFRNTLILLVVAGALCAYLILHESKQPTTTEAESQGRYVVQFDESKINGITITNNDTKIVLSKQPSGEWAMEAPVQDRAADDVVAQLLSTAASLEKETSWTPDPGKENIRDYGLEKPNVTLQLEGDGAPREILFGKDTDIENKEYLKLASSNEVIVAPGVLRAEVAKSADDFRSHQLSDVPATQVDKVNIKTAAGEIELARDQDHWEIDKPIKARGDDGKISDLVSQMLETKIDSFVPADQVGAANTALNDAQQSVTLAAEGVDKPVVLEFSKPTEKDPQKVYAKLSTRDALFLMPKAAAAIFDTRPNDVRDRHLIRLNLDVVDRIHIAPAGVPEILLSRKGEDWTIKSMNDKPANSGDVQKMASTLQDQLVTSFVSDVATDLAKYGLDQPQLKVTFSSYASENTAETKAGEEPIETILFGEEDGNNVYAKLDDEPFIVSVPKSVLDGIHTDPLQWQDLAIYNLKPENIVGMDVTRQGQATLSLVKDSKAGWKLAKGDIALDTVNIESIANTLSTLRAVQWAGAQKPAQGLDAPAETITFTMADKTSNTLKIGAPSGDYWNATATGADGVFLINKPDHDALTADVLPTAIPAATPPVPSPGSTPSADNGPGGVEVTTSPVEAK